MKCATLTQIIRRLLNSFVCKCLGFCVVYRCVTSMGGRFYVQNPKLCTQPLAQNESSNQFLNITNDTFVPNNNKIAFKKKYNVV